MLDQLAQFGPVHARAMFGGHGLYLRGTFFGIVFKGRLFLATDVESRREYLREGMGPFRPSPRQTLARYYEVPAEVLEDSERLVLWAQRAAAIRPNPG